MPSLLFVKAPGFAATQYVEDNNEIDAQTDILDADDTKTIKCRTWRPGEQLADLTGAPRVFQWGAQENRM